MIWDIKDVTIDIWGGGPGSIKRVTATHRPTGLSHSQYGTMVVRTSKEVFAALREKVEAHPPIYGGIIVIHVEGLNAESRVQAWETLEMLANALAGHSDYIVRAEVQEVSGG